MSAAPYLVVEDVAKLLGVSRRTVHELTRTGRVPHRVLPHGRRCLFEEPWLRAWADGAELERIELPGGGRIVRPREGT
jgi:excisionase family DNA binding protein